jgi:hypothetical protein
MWNGKLSKTTYEYDALDRISKQTDPKGNDKRDNQIKKGNWLSANFPKRL